MAGAAPETADPHVSAAAVPSHVPPRHTFPRRPAEDDPADAAGDGGMLRSPSWDVWLCRGEISSLASLLSCWNVLKMFDSALSSPDKGGPDDGGRDGALQSRQQD